MINKSSLINRKASEYDKTLLIVVAVIVIIGLIMLTSASVAVGLNRFGDSGFYIKRQLLALVLGLAAGYYAFQLDYRRWRSYSFVVFMASLVFLVLIFIPGIGVGGQGAQRWIRLPFINFQPAELVKLTLVLYLSAWLVERGEKVVRDFRAGVLPFLGLMGVLFILIIKQPDLGTLLVISFIGVMLYFIGGAHPKHMAGFLLGGLALVGLAIKVAPYRLARIATFLNPGADPLGAGYHINQAMLAVGSGGLVGLGLGHSRQKFLYLPEVTNDSLFAVIAEELGFILSVGLIFLFMLILWRGVKIARAAPDDYGTLVAAGITLWIAGQAFINIGAIIGVVPLTGIPLPLMSYGGSALVVTLIGIGILLNISKGTKS